MSSSSWNKADYAMVGFALCLSLCLVLFMRDNKLRQQINDQKPTATARSVPGKAQLELPLGNYEPITRTARVHRIIDGDTIDVLVDLGLDVYVFVRLRLKGVNTPELRTGSPEERARGQQAKEFVERAVGDKDVVLKIFGKGKYGRTLALVFYDHPGAGGSPKNLSEELIKAGLAEEYNP